MVHSAILDFGSSTLDFQIISYNWCQITYIKELFQGEERSANTE